MRKFQHKGFNDSFFDKLGESIILPMNFNIIKNLNITIATNKGSEEEKIALQSKLIAQVIKDDNRPNEFNNSMKGIALYNFP